MPLTLSGLLNRAKTVKNETVEEANDAYRIGSLFEDIISFFSNLSGVHDSLIVDNYSDLIDLEIPSVRTEVLVISDEKNNSGETSEYTIWPNGTIMWKASININKL
jgi:hypothetical protein